MERNDLTKKNVSRSVRPLLSHFTAALNCNKFFKHVLLHYTENKEIKLLT